MSYYSAQVVFIITLFTWAILRSICLIDSSLLQMEVSALSPRVAFLDHQRSLLTVGNSHLKQRIAALAQDKIFKDGIQILLFSLVRIYLVLNMLVRLDLNWYQICNVMQLIKRRWRRRSSGYANCSTSSRSRPPPVAPTSPLPPRCRPGKSCSRARVLPFDSGGDRRSAQRVPTCIVLVFWGAVHRVQRHTC